MLTGMYILCAGKRLISLCVVGFPVILNSDHFRNGVQDGAEYLRKTVFLTDWELLLHKPHFSEKWRGSPWALILRWRFSFHDFEVVRCLIANQAVKRKAFLFVRRDEMLGKRFKLAFPPGPWYVPGTYEMRVFVISDLKAQTEKRTMAAGSRECQSLLCARLAGRCPPLLCCDW